MDDILISFLVPPPPQWVSPLVFEEEFELLDVFCFLGLRAFPQFLDCDINALAFM